MWTKSLERHSKPWHADDIDQLGALLFEENTIPQIAAAMGRTQEAVRRKAQSLDMLPQRARPRSPPGADTLAFFVHDL